jgi:hypothetical protein
VAHTIHVAAAAEWPSAHQFQAEEGSISFLNKRTKKLFSIAVSIRLSRLNRMPDAIDKSFLFLFFKKEDSPFFLKWH